MISQSREAIESSLDLLVDEICDQIQAGNPPSLEVLIAQHPDMADRLRVIYPAVLAMANWSASNGITDTLAIGLDSQANREIGDYRIVRQIGRGGMGVVYEAEQLSIPRNVALKILPLAALVDHRALQRFKNEVAAVATLEHPHIVSVYAIGEDRGIHYFAMQLIRGQSLAAVIRELRDSADRDERLHGKSLQQVVSDLEYSSTTLVDEKGSGAFCAQHPKGRSGKRLLTPFHLPETVARGRSSTIRKFGDSTYFRNVAELIRQAADALQHAHDHGIVHRDVKPGNLLLDAHGKLFVTDFGLARIETGTAVTMTGDFLGTLLYMSPEQVQGNRQVVDHRSDIYSLGATLYELLTLQPMWDGDNKAELVRQISSEEPIRPQRLNPAIPTDLETIVMKAISKTPDDRFRSARSLADDLQNYLDHRTINVKRPGLVSRFTKWSRRNQPIVVSALLIFLLATIGLAASNVLISKQKQIADQKTLEAQQESRYARAIADFVKNDLLTLTTPDGQEHFDEFSDYQLSESATFKDLLDRAAEKLEERKDLDPGIKGDLSWIVGVNYGALGEHDAALSFLRQSVDLNRAAYGDFDVRTLKAQLSLARALAAAEQLDEAIDFAEHTFDRCTREFGVNHELSFSSELSLGTFYYQNGKLTEAAKHLENALPKLRDEYGEDDVNTLSCLHHLGSLYVDQGHTEEGIQLLQQVLRLRKATLGNDHKDTLRSMVILGQVYSELSLFEEALALLEEQLQLRSAKLGPEHPDTLISIHHLGWVYRDAGRLDQAKSMFEVAFEKRKAVLGADHQLTLMSMESLGEVSVRTGQIEKGLALLEEITDFERNQLGARHPETLNSLISIAWEYANSNQYEQAIQIFESVVEIHKQQLGINNPEVINTMTQFAWVLNNAGLIERSLPLFRQLVDLNVDQQFEINAEPDSEVWKHNRLFHLAWAYYKTGQLNDAIPLFEQTLEMMKAKLGDGNSDLAPCMSDLGTAYSLTNQPNKAIKLLTTLVAIETAYRGKNHPKTLLANCYLGAAYREADRIEEALSLLEPTAHDLDRGQGAVHPYTMLARSQLVATYCKAGQLEKALQMSEQMLDVTQSIIGIRNAETFLMANLTASIHLQLGSWRNAESLLRPLLEHNDPIYGDQWHRYISNMMLGQALTGQHKFADAETMMLAGFSWLAENRKLTPPCFPLLDHYGNLIAIDRCESHSRIAEAIERLINFYEAWHEAEPDAGYDSKVTQWREKLDDEINSLQN